MKRFQDEKNKLIEQKRKILLRLLFILIFALLGTQIVISNAVSATGDQLQHLEQRYLTLRQQNEQLKQEIALSTSLNIMEQKAKLLGFIKNDSVIYLQNSVNVAMNGNQP